MSQRNIDKNKDSIAQLGLKIEYSGLGRRKTSVARVWFYPKGEPSLSKVGQMIVNGISVEQYFPGEDLRQRYLEPLFACALPINKVCFSAKINGGGITGQLDALRLGLARAVLEFDPSQREVLRKRGLLTRDPRMVETKKYNLHKARRAHQFSKR
ncbi:30S ribosomal protein S9 [candidate division WWE3 bacterium CG08_land_8_20_14_0_20_43_13]|uniref:Small ribosomal subunit protein uS9 n=1 Tax=candidate division WWE3 bacterium CG08_land_8_20_14_0_20_43_13 TaxID=1975087 RepID=A0A2H0X9A6_UNCKA|nr:MAG: 30S ribosomal protein S9 [candidate division WWE3 bacterium CG08_land_8_20_14_0_20_43_13]